MIDECQSILTELIVDRRSRERCEVCQGPTKLVDGKVVCRNSLCSFNFRQMVCPRCGHVGAECLDYRDLQYKLSCSECLNSWSVQA